MSAWTSTITEKGIALNNKTITGKKITLTKAQSGSGSVPVVDLKKQTAIMQPKQIFDIKKPIQKEDGTFMIQVLLDNTDLSFGYSLYQLGIYAEDPDEGEILYMIAQNDTAETIPSKTDAPGFCLEWNFNFKNSMSKDFEVVVNVAGIATLEEVIALINDNESPYYIKLKADSWSSEVPYSQEVIVPDVESIMCPDIDKYLDKNDTIENQRIAEKNASMITRAETGDGKITFYCYKKKPSADFMLKIKGIPGGGGSLLSGLTLGFRVKAEE